ncbi:MAG: methyltransferase [Ferruginibacter sp.]
MPNNYFQFKQFTVFQDKCAMKVCTDACLFGAIIANYQMQTANCLDIGTGTGLLSLMYAQKNDNAIIDAVEIDKDAAEQAKNNFTASPWAERLHVFNTDVLVFKAEKKYDCIISNPPFFEDDLKSTDENKNKAKHDTSLSLIQLLQIVETHLNKDGIFAVLLPYHRVNYFIEEVAKANLYLNQQILVRQTAKHDFFRGILFFSPIKNKLQNTEIIIKDNEGKYTDAFVAALKDYYLYL